MQSMPSPLLGHRPHKASRSWATFFKCLNCIPLLWCQLPDCGAICFTLVLFSFPPVNSGLRLLVLILSLGLRREWTFIYISNISIGLPDPLEVDKYSSTTVHWRLFQVIRLWWFFLNSCLQRSVSFFCIGHCGALWLCTAKKDSHYIRIEILILIFNEKRCRIPNVLELEKGEHCPADPGFHTRCPVCQRCCQDMWSVPSVSSLCLPKCTSLIHIEDLALSSMDIKP